MVPRRALNFLPLLVGCVLLLTLAPPYGAVLSRDEGILVILLGFLGTLGMILLSPR